MSWTQDLRNVSQAVYEKQIRECEEAGTNAFDNFRSTIADPKSKISQVMFNAAKNGKFGHRIDLPITGDSKCAVYHFPRERFQKEFPHLNLHSVNGYKNELLLEISWNPGYQGQSHYF